MRLNTARSGHVTFAALPFTVAFLGTRTVSYGVAKRLRIHKDDADDEDDDGDRESHVSAKLPEC